MRAASRESLAITLTELDKTMAKSSVDPQVLGEQAFALSDILMDNHAVLAGLTDPAREAQAKSTLIGRLTEGKVSPELAALTQQMATQRWSAPVDFAEALEEVGISAYLISAERAGHLEKVEDEAFRIIRMLAAHRKLRYALMDRHAPAEKRSALMSHILSGKVTEESRLLAARAAAAAGRYASTRSLLAGLSGISDRAAARRKSLVASVISAVPLSSAQEQRLTAILTKRMGRAVTVHQGIDPSVIGGLRISIGPEVIDATIASRLAQLRRSAATIHAE